MRKILIVDDEENIRLLYKEEFEDEGYQVVLASTADEAWKKIHEEHPDIVSIDIKMPGTDGITFMQRLKKEHVDISVILCSAYDRYVQDFRVWACEGYVVKSANLTELKKTVKQALHHKPVNVTLCN